MSNLNELNTFEIVAMGKIAQARETFAIKQHFGMKHGGAESPDHLYAMEYLILDNLTHDRDVPSPTKMFSEIRAEVSAAKETRMKHFQDVVTKKIIAVRSMGMPMFTINTNDLPLLKSEFLHFVEFFEARGVKMSRTIPYEDKTADTPGLVYILV